MTISRTEFEAMERRVNAKRERVAELSPVRTAEVTTNLRIVICNQIRGGKNNMGVTRSGRHYPKAAWKSWRDDAVRSVREQLPRNFKPFNAPINVRLDYVAGDNRRRDFPAICDAIWHVLERAGVVTDDTLLWPTESSRSYDKNSPRATIEFIELTK